ncbi:MAG TPA: HAD family hydrolase [Vicinamibacteria bacterium]|nr:HAD family hydrolase [Vicinamibacteria bacterium]
MPEPDGFRAVLFDWDGTLVDSAERTFACYARVFAVFGIAFDRAAFERTYSPDWYRTYADIGLPREHWTDADARWISCYETEPGRLLPGAREALLGLAGRGLALGLVSSGEGGRVRREIRTLGLAPFFAAVVCGGDTARRKPDPEPLLVALGRLGVPPAETAYVGDSPEDVAMAKAAGVVAVGVPGGFPNREGLVASAPDVFAPTLDEALRTLLAGR